MWNLYAQKTLMSMYCEYSPWVGPGQWPVVFELAVQTHSEDEPSWTDAPTSLHPAFCNHNNIWSSYKATRLITRQYILWAMSVNQKLPRVLRTESPSKLYRYLLILLLLWSLRFPFICYYLYGTFYMEQTLPHWHKPCK